MVGTKIYGIRAAAREAGVSRAAVHRWCVKYPDLAKNEGGRMTIDRDKLRELVLARATLKGEK